MKDSKIRSDTSTQGDRPLGKAIRIRLAAWIGLLVALCCASTLVAQDSSLQIHGFGGWSYGKTDHGNLYLGGLPDGNYDRTELSLNLEDQLSDRLRVVAQVDFDQTEMGHDTGIDYAFVEWRFSDKLRIRAGQVKLPFGIYAEITDVGTLRPFLRLPQGVYGPVGFAGENYKGIGITGTLDGASKWSYAYDLYAGGTQLEEFLPPEAFLRGQPVSTSTEVENESTRNVLGGRFTVRTPIDGLEVGVSAYSGTLIAARSPQRSVAATHASFLNDRWSIRSEFAYEHSSHDLTARGFYLEPAYHITPHWQVAAQYDLLSTQLSGVPNPSEPSFLIHREGALGLNYWVSPKFVFKMSLHRVDGNRFAAPPPESYARLVAAGELQHKTTLMLFGVNFSF